MSFGTLQGTDGFDLLEAVHADHAPAWLREVAAVVVLQTVWITQYHRTVTDGRQEVIWREDKYLPPSRDRICSPYDTDARYATKRGSGWEGYQVHLSETCDDATVTGLTPPHHQRRYHRRDRHRCGDAGAGPHCSRPPQSAS
jgi:hypothetical protein